MIGLRTLPWAWEGATSAPPPTAPTLTARSPAFGPVGTLVTLTGTNLSTASMVQLGVSACAFVIVNATTITATVPTGAVTGNFSVTTPDGTATLDAPFTVTSIAAPVPTLASFTPTSGPAGTVVTLTGTNLSGVSLVAIGGVAAPFTSVNATTITATVPAGASTGPWIAMSADGVAVSPSLFTVTVATVASTRTLVWALEVFPAAQPAGLGRVLLKASRNAIVVRDVIDKESDTYLSPASVTWSLLEGADIAAEGTMTASGDGFRGEVILDPAIATGPGPVLRITATLGGASWVREYPITISTQS